VVRAAIVAAANEAPCLLFEGVVLMGVAEALGAGGSLHAGSQYSL